MRTTLGMLALTALLAVPAGASSHCPLVTDPQGDGEIFRANVYFNPGTRNDPAVDIVSADIASDASLVTGVVRVLDLDDPLLDAKFGAAYSVSFAVATPTGRWRFELSAWRNTYGQSDADVALYRDGAIAGRWIGKATAVFDEVASEVRITAPMSVLRAEIDVDQYSLAEGIQAATWGRFDNPPSVGSGRMALGTDEASGSGTYTLGTTGCITPGA